MVRFIATAALPKLNPMNHSDHTRPFVWYFAIEVLEKNWSTSDTNKGTVHKVSSLRIFKSYISIKSYTTVTHNPSILKPSPSPSAQPRQTHS